MSEDYVRIAVKTNKAGSEMTISTFVTKEDWKEMDEEEQGEVIRECLVQNLDVWVIE